MTSRCPLFETESELTGEKKVSQRLVEHPEEVSSRLKECLKASNGSMQSVKTGWL
jgi:hypothetical protein